MKSAKPENLFPRKEAFSQLLNDQQVDLFILQSGKISVAITNYGARIVGLVVTKENKFTNVVVGYDSLQEYLTTDEIYHGAIIGRYANRIAKGKFVLEGKQYSLATNNGSNHLHGGVKGYHDVVWNVETHSTSSVSLSYLSKDREENYPGNLNLLVTYTLNDEGLKISFEASTDETTILNLTNHAYFNLNGKGPGNIEGHLLQINADHFIPIDEALIPTGDLEKVDGTPFDFRKAKKIGAEIYNDHTQLKYGNGYDHNYALNKKGVEKSLAARAIGDQSGIILEVHTTEPGMQFYSGGFEKGIKERTSFCLETQHFPDSPNHPGFPSTVLRPGEKFYSETSFIFPGN